MIVSNTTPLSNLIQLQLLTLLGDLWGVVSIPMAVQHELERGSAFLGNWQDAEGASAIQVREVPSDPLTQQFLLSLHLGEAEALTLAIREHVSLFLCDDLDARRAANHHGIPVTGTLGLLLKAKQEGLIPEVLPYLERLRQEVRFWFTDDLYRQLQELANES
jgi:predicted nucleic acid-binding protein